MTQQAQQSTQDPEQLQVDTSSPPDGGGGRLTERQRTVLVRLLRVAYPHDRFPDGPYERTAAAVEEAAGEQPGDLAAGLDALDDSAGGDFTELDESGAVTLLREVEDAAFFVAIRSTTVVALYDDREVWELLGYEGESFSSGGYLHRGFDDLDWLPDPRVTESDAPRVEFVEEGTR